MSFPNIYSAAGERMRNLNTSDNKKSSSSDNQSDIKIPEEKSPMEEEKEKKVTTHYNLYSAVAHRMRYGKDSDEEKKASASDSNANPSEFFKDDSNENFPDEEKTDGQERVKTNIDMLVSVAHKMRYIDTTPHETINFKKLFSRFKK